MNRDDLQKKAKKLEIQMNERRKDESFLNVMAWLGYLGLLRNNFAKSKRVRVTLTDALRAAEIEHRVYELLPSILFCIPEALPFKQRDIPKDLNDVLRSMKKNPEALKSYQGIQVEKYMHWTKSEIMEVAKRKLSFRTAPRQRKSQPSEIGRFVRDSRMKLVLTQEDLAKRVDVSVRVIRDLEQGQLSASLANVSKILDVFSAKLKVGS